MLGGLEFVCGYLTLDCSSWRNLILCVAIVKSGPQLHAMVIQGRCFTGLMLTKAQHGALFSLAMTEKALMDYIPEYC